MAARKQRDTSLTSRRAMQTRKRTMRRRTMRRRTRRRRTKRMAPPPQPPRLPLLQIRRATRLPRLRLRSTRSTVCLSHCRLHQPGRLSKSSSAGSRPKPSQLRFIASVRALQSRWLKRTAASSKSFTTFSCATLRCSLGCSRSPWRTSTQSCPISSSSRSSCHTSPALRRELVSRRCRRAWQSGSKRLGARTTASLRRRPCGRRRERSCSLACLRRSSRPATFDIRCSRLPAFFSDRHSHTVRFAPRRMRASRSSAPRSRTSSPRQPRSSFRSRSRSSSRFSSPRSAEGSRRTILRRPRRLRRRSGRTPCSRESGSGPRAAALGRTRRRRSQSHSRSRVSSPRQQTTPFLRRMRASSAQ
mmetsp:Transcript_22682/g.73778  ORF Transcript_22682/g.73778 Transcript_22682/m.73778 type:complete len:359 (-) Transcript_22682:678-1754(-)